METGKFWKTRIYYRFRVFDSICKQILTCLVVFFTYVFFIGFSWLEESPNKNPTNL